MMSIFNNFPSQECDDAPPRVVCFPGSFKHRGRSGTVAVLRWGDGLLDTKTGSPFPEEFHKTSRFSGALEIMVFMGKSSPFMALTQICEITIIYPDVYRFVLCFD